MTLYPALSQILIQLQADPTDECSHREHWELGNLESVDLDP